eukprot:scaffold172254_cov31-Tisochrysis_lutea.AAC.2
MSPHKASAHPLVAHPRSAQTCWLLMENMPVSTAHRSSDELVCRNAACSLSTDIGAFWKKSLTGMVTPSVGTQVEHPKTPWRDPCSSEVCTPNPHRSPRANPVGKAREESKCTITSPEHTIVSPSFHG